MKNLILILLSLCFVYTLSFVVYYAPYEFRLRASQMQVDKIFHAAAGFLIAMLFTDVFALRNSWLIFIIVLGVAVGWETLELFLNPWTLEFSMKPQFSSLSDTLGDIAATIGGAILYLPVWY